MILSLGIPRTPREAWQLPCPKSCPKKAPAASMGSWWTTTTKTVATALARKAGAKYPEGSSGVYVSIPLTLERLYVTSGNQPKISQVPWRQIGYQVPEYPSLGIND
jgi:hypothetical protein